LSARRHPNALAFQHVITKGAKKTDFFAPFLSTVAAAFDSFFIPGCFCHK
jgi:hypothetical protein